ncbi:MAG: hypothetical protein ABI779_18645 [Acidobacteriota bacterium]
MIRVVQTTFPELRDRTAALIERLVAYGIQVSAGSRLLRYRSELELASVEQYSDPPAEVRRLWHRLLAEVDDFETILTVLPVEPELTGWQEKVQVALDGGVLRTDEKKHSPARDYQFELVVASVFRQAGYRVELAEPDVIVETSLGPFGIASKRPRVESKVERNVRDARHQIEQTTGSGAIAVDVSILVNPNDIELEVRRFVAAVAYVAQYATNKTKKVAATVGRSVGTDNVAGVIGYAAMPTWEPNERRMSYIKRWPIVALVPPADPRREILEEFAERLRYMEEPPSSSGGGSTQPPSR